MQVADALRKAVRTIPDFPKPGVQFKDITPILGDPALLEIAVDLLAQPFAQQTVNKVVGLESRGFIFGPSLARRLGAGFVPIRKQGRLPHDTVSVAYDLEYGTDIIEMHVDALQPGERVLIHDDVIATGGTAAACHKLVGQLGAVVVGFSFLIELGTLNGRARLPTHTPFHAVLSDC